jgi:hypothetical protein
MKTKNGIKWGLRQERTGDFFFGVRNYGYKDHENKKRNKVGFAAGKDW